MAAAEEPTNSTAAAQEIKHETDIRSIILINSIEWYKLEIMVPSSLAAAAAAPLVATLKQQSSCINRVLL